MTQTYPKPPPAGSYTPAWVRGQTVFGGAVGDDLSTSTATLVTDVGSGNGPNTATDYAPRTQTAKAALVGMPIASDVGSPRGYIDPNEAYGPAPVSPTDDPTITSLAPNTGVSGGSPIWVTITGTKFTQWSSVETGGVVTPYSRFLSATKLAVLMDPRSTPGTVVVKVIDHGVKSAGSNFTFT